MPDVQQIRLDPDPFEPYALSQGFRVGDLVFVSGQAALDEQGRIVGPATSTPRPSRRSAISRGCSRPAARASNGS